MHVCVCACACRPGTYGEAGCRILLPDTLVVQPVYVFQVWVSGSRKCSLECVGCAQGTSALLRPEDRGFVLQSRKMRV